jgi:hypothetical protein
MEFRVIIQRNYSTSKLHVPGLNLSTLIVKYMFQELHFPVMTLIVNYQPQYIFQEIICRKTLHKKCHQAGVHLAFYPYDHGF